MGLKNKNSMTNIKYIEIIIHQIPKYIQKIKIRNNEIVIKLKNPLYLNNVLYFLKNNSNMLYKSLIDITCVDNINKNKRFELSYNLISFKYNSRIRIIINVTVFDKVKTVTQIFASSCWLEREIWDLFGIYFEEHPDLRRILTDYGFEGYPLRKDFPLTGFLELRYNDEEKCVVYESLETSQGFRLFSFLSPWNQVNNLKNFIK